MRGFATAGVAVSIVAAVVIAATLADGRTASQTDTHDGGAWLLNRDAGAIGHVDRRSREVSGSVRVSEPRAGFDVDQARGVVVVHDFSSASATLVDQANYSASSAVAAPDTLQVLARDQGLVVIDHDPVSIRHVTVSDLADLERLEEAPVALQGEGPGLGVVDRAGRTVLADETGTVLAEDADGEVRTTELGSLEARPAQLTVVGDIVVVLTEAGELRSVASRSTTLDPPDDLRAGDWTLQQPSESAGGVVAISPDGVVHTVDLSDGVIREVRALPGGLPVEPIVHGGCTFALVTQPVMFTRICGDQVLEDDLGLEGRASGQLRLRLVNGWVWINDIDTGASWVTDPESDVARIDDWHIALAEQEAESEEEEVVADGAADEQRENPDAAEVISALELLDLDGPNEPPVARPDTAATREGRPVVVDVLANDTDPNGDVLLITDVDNRSPEDAVVTITGDRTAIQVVPAAGFTGTLRFSYTITDGRGGTASAEVTVNVTPMDPDRNRPPQPVTDVATVRAGESVTLNVLANDSDPDGDRLHLLEVTGEGVRTAFSPDGLVTLTPDPDQEGRIELEYLVADEFGATATGRILLDVRLPDSNLAPVARNDAGQTVVGNRIVLDVLANDSDPDGDRLIVQSQPQLLQAPAGADPFVHLDARGRLDFEPDVAGTYVLMYTISDGSLTDSALIRIEVGAADDNRPPVAVRDDVVVPVGASRIVPVLANDFDPDGDVISIVDWTGADGLEIQLIDGDRFRVTALPSAPPVTSFRYTISDGVNEPVSAIVSVLVVDDAAVLPPVAKPDEVEVRAGQVSTVDVLDNDHDPAGGPLRVVGVSEPEGASIGITGDQQQVVLDIPATTERGFTVGYEIENDHGDRAASTIEVRIVPPDDPNRAPIAGTDIARTLEARPVAIDVLANDRDPDGDPLVLEGIARQPANGTARVLDDDRIQYTPDPGFTGTDRFAYTIADTGGLRATGEVLIGVTGRWDENRPPQAQDDTAAATAGGPAVTIDVLANDFDPDGDPLTVVAVGEVRLGRAQLATDGASVVYVPPDSIDGAEAEAAFTYRIDDGRGGQDEAVVTITITEVAAPEPPEAVDDRVGPVPAGERISIDVLANDRVPASSRDGLTLTVSNPALEVVDGQVALTAPDATSTYRYTITDAFEQSSSATITVQVSPNRPPVVAPLTVETGVDTVIDLDLTGQASDPDGDELFFACCDTVRGGSATVTSEDARTLTVRFQPTGVAGSRAAFSYIVDDQQGHQVAGSVSIDIQAPEDEPPVARDTEVEVEADGTRSVDLRALVDDDRPVEELTFSTGTVRGPIEVTRDGGTLRLRAAVDAAGATASVAYTATDRAGQSDSGTVQVRITPTSAALPQARTDQARLLQGQPLVVRVLDNDIGDGLRVVGAGGSANLSAEVADDGGAVRLTPDGGFFGSTTASYTIRDRFDDPGREVDGRIEVTVIGRPDAPGAPRVTADSRLATLVWDAPTSNGAPIDRYEVEHDQGGTRELDRTSAYTWTGLTNGTTYRFRVRAGNEAGWSDWSVASSPVIPDQLPGRPSVPSVAFGDRELTVTWQPPSNEGSPITSYVLEIGGATTGVRNLPSTGGQSQSYTWTGLTNGANHTFRIKAVNSADEGGGDFSGWTEPEHPLTQPSAPPTPRLDSGPNYLDVSWSRPDDGGDAIQEYEIQIDSPSGRTVRVSGANTTSYRWGDLSNGVDHRFRVRAWNRDSRGGQWTTFSEPGRACDVPDQVTGVTAIPGDRSVVLSWQAPPSNGCSITGFGIINIFGWGGSERLLSADASARSLTVDGLRNGDEYIFGVWAINEQGAGEEGFHEGRVIPAGPPTAPRISSVTATGERELTVTWERADPNGSAITRYEWRKNSGPTRNAGDTISTVDTDGLNATSNYCYQVRAVNGVGAGEWSAERCAQAEGRPGSVGNLRESSSTTSSVTWSWNAPASNGGSSLTGYQVGRGGTGSPISIGTSPRSYTWSGLTADRTYRLHVRACNRWGCGAWQDATGRTDAPPQPSISISYGEQSNVTGCSASTCRRIEVAARNFQPNTNYTVVCHDAKDASYWSYGITTNGSGDSNSNTCRNGETGTDVWVTIGSVRSNTIRQ